MMIMPKGRGGVEEKKDDSMDNILYPNTHLTNQQSSYDDENQQQIEDDDEQMYGFQAQWQRFANSVFGSCGNAIEAASQFLAHQGCRWPSPAPAEHAPQHYFNEPPPRPPLSIAEEIRKLVQAEGGVNMMNPLQGFRRTDIPKFLGEEAVYDFDDDNISAISQNTLEEMARHGVIQAQYARMRQMQKNNYAVPPPFGTSSDSSSQSSGRPPPRITGQSDRVQIV